MVESILAAGSGRQTHFQNPFSITKMQERIHEVRKRKKGVVMTFDIAMFALFFVAIVGTLAYFGVSAYMQNTKETAAAEELQQIRTAYTNYMTYSLTDPTSLNQLFDDIPSASSMDGRAHSAFLTKTGRWAGGELIDPWGNKYTLNTGDMTISSTAGGKGSTISVKVGTTSSSGS